MSPLMVAGGNGSRVDDGGRGGLGLVGVIGSRGVGGGSGGFGGVTRNSNGAGWGRGVYPVPHPLPVPCRGQKITPSPYPSGPHSMPRPRSQFNAQNKIKSILYRLDEKIKINNPEYWKSLDRLT